MRIGFDAKRAFNNYTGLGNYSRFIIEALLEYSPEHQYFAYTPKIKGNWHNSLADFPSELHVQLPRAYAQLPAALWRSWFIAKDLQQDKIHIFHGLSNEIPYGLKKTGVKSVVSIHDLIFLRYPEQYPVIDRFVYQRKFRYACENADAIVAVSEQTKRDIIDFYQIPSERIEVIYQGCQPTFCQRIADKTIINQVLQKYGLKKSYILCVASFTERKNQLRLIKAFQQLPAKEHDLVLVGGKSEYLSKLKQYVHQSHMQERVHFVTGVPAGDLPALYQGCSLFVYPSLFEGFGIPIIEALHSGVPVVAATGSCLEEAGGAGALYANPLDVNDIAEKMHHVLTSEVLQNRLINKGTEHVKKFAAKPIAEKLVKLYTDL
ncbi:glycosyltransferase family 1 protein [Emticicia sp. BO119]|uniref:glycosyltransferase family 4 protein n=1 Tax=Emticicia sp. BO119 TaxID=2757768 RepID=UPI0015F01FD8|nr:glycosyltransferase family 1 protein [Emticicia sp. BO119]MBA4850417.1 glycosyltransferase family 4 protein [Emticicia sp. BO119]